MTDQEIYGWHIVHAETGLSFGFCLRECAGQTLEESDVLNGFVGNPDDFTLIPLVRAGRLQ